MQLFVLWLNFRIGRVLWHFSASRCLPLSVCVCVCVSVSVSVSVSDGTLCVLAWCLPSALAAVSWPRLLSPFRMPGLNAIEWVCICVSSWSCLPVIMSTHPFTFHRLFLPVFPPPACFTSWFFLYLLFLPPSIFLPSSQDISAFLPQNLPPRLTLFFLILLLTVQLGSSVFHLIILKVRSNLNAKEEQMIKL